jgi:hypothetical protein
MVRPRRSAGSHVLAVPRYAQPDEVSCGPTCLAQVYHHYGDRIPLDEVLVSTRRNDDGGTLAVFLGQEALARGYRARIYSYNLRVFDPTWFALREEPMRAKLRARAAVVSEEKLRTALLAYESFLARGGKIAFRELTPVLLMAILDRGRPILTGLSSTYLYRQMRERPDTNVDDDVGGDPVGHFVVISGYTRAGERFALCDPSVDAPLGRSGRYDVAAPRLINSILLGSVTYDGVLLELWRPTPRSAA